MRDRKTFYGGLAVAILMISGLLIWSLSQREVPFVQDPVGASPVVARNQSESTPPVVHDTESERESDVNRTEVPVEADLPDRASSKEAMQLFSSPDYGSIEYQDALSNASRHLAGSRRQGDTRSIQLLNRNEAAIDELVRQLGSNPNGLATAFEISPANVHACTISSIEDRSPDFTPGVLIPSSFSVETSCNESGNGVTVTVDQSEIGIVGFAIRSVQGGVSILSVDESGYAVAFQRYPFIPSRE